MISRDGATGSYALHSKRAVFAGEELCLSGVQSFIYLHRILPNIMPSLVPAAAVYPAAQLSFVIMRDVTAKMMGSDCDQGESLADLQLRCVAADAFAGKEIAGFWKMVEATYQDIQGAGGVPYIPFLACQCLDALKDNGFVSGDRELGLLVPCLSLIQAALRAAAAMALNPANAMVAKDVRDLYTYVIEQFPQLRRYNRETQQWEPK